MPMIVDPGAPLIEPPESVTSPDGWFTAVVDTTYAGVILGVDYTAGTPYGSAADVRKVRIMRQDPGGAAAVPVRSADTAWAIEGVGAAYDHEAPLGVAVVYAATAILADGSEGPTSSLSVTVPEPDPPADVWIKSIDTPGLSARVTVVSWPQLSWATRQDSATPQGSRYPAVAQDVYAAATSSIVVDAEGAAIATMRDLLLAGGVLLLQTRTDYHRPDQFVVFGNVQGDLDGAPDGAWSFTADVTEVERPATEGQPMRMPGWSYDILAAQYATYDAAAATFATYQALATNGAL